MPQKQPWHVIILLCLYHAIALTLPAVSYGMAVEYRLVSSFPVTLGEPSGLTYDPKTDTLWAVSDGGDGIYQIDKQGKVLKKLDTPSHDLEGIAYNPNTDTFLLAEERNREIVEINRQGKVLRTIKVPVKWRFWHINHGIEGVSYDPETGHIFVVNEKSPRAVMELDESGKITKSFDVDEADDLSGIFWDGTSGKLLVLSHESKRVMEFTPDGELTGLFQIDVPQAEGITRDANGNIYIICETSRMLYVYAPATD